MKRILISIAATLLVALSYPIDIIDAKSIKEYEREIKELEEKKKGVESKKSEVDGEQSEVKTKKNENLNEQASVSEKLDKITREVNETEEKIKLKDEEIKSIQEDIKELIEEIKSLTKEIRELELRIEERERMLSERLKSMQENGGNIKYLEVILGSQTFTDLITRSSAVNTMMDSDKNILEEHVADQKSLETKEREVRTSKANLEGRRAELEGEKQTFNNLKAELKEQEAMQAKLKKELEEEYTELEEYDLSLQEEEAILEAETQALEKAKALANSKKKQLEEKKKAESFAISGSVPAGTGELQRPSSGRITSPFGYRIHPISKAQRLHGGIDFGAPTGSAVVAAESGVVGTVNSGCSVGNAGCGGGFGNYITITHFVNGKSITTLYAHLSSISVASGQQVSRGQTIGGVGNTGSSTGPHLHFEVHTPSYGNKVNPSSYIN